MQNTWYFSFCAFWSTGQWGEGAIAPWLRYWFTRWQFIKLKSPIDIIKKQPKCQKQNRTNVFVTLLQEKFTVHDKEHSLQQQASALWLRNIANALSLALLPKTHRRHKRACMTFQYSSYTLKCLRHNRYSNIRHNFNCRRAAPSCERSPSFDRTTRRPWSKFEVVLKFIWHSHEVTNRELITQHSESCDIARLVRSVLSSLVVRIVASLTDIAASQSICEEPCNHRTNPLIVIYLASANPDIIFPHPSSYNTNGHLRNKCNRD